MEERFVTYEDFLGIVSDLEKKIDELEKLSKAWRLIAESLLGVQKEY